MLLWHMLVFLLFTVGEQPVILEGHRATVDAIAVSPDGAQFASGSWDHTIRLWSLPDGEAQQVLDGHQADILALAYSPDGRYLISAGLDFKAVVWDMDTLEPALTFDRHTRPIRAIVFHPDGEQVLTAGDNGEVYQWDVATGAVTQTYTGHTSAVLGAAFLADGEQLVTVDRRGTIILWQDGAVVNQVVYRPAAKLLAVTSDGTPVTAHVDGGLRFWDAATLTVEDECQPGALPINEMAIDASDTIFVGDFVGRVFACDAGTSEQIAALPEGIMSLALWQDHVILGMEENEPAIWIVSGEG